MKNVSRIVLAIIIVAAGVWLWRALFPSPEKIIASQFEKLARATSIQPGQGYIPRMAGAERAGGFFATNVELNIDFPGHKQQTVVSRDDIVQAIMAAHLNGGLKVKFQDIAVNVSADQQTAQTEVTLEAKATFEQDIIVQEMRFTLQKIDGKWFITKVQTIRTFS